MGGHMARSQGNLDAQANLLHISCDLGFLRLEFSFVERRPIRDNCQYKSSDRQHPWHANNWGSSSHSQNLNFLIGRIEEINITHCGDREKKIEYELRAMGRYSFNSEVYLSSVTSTAYRKAWRSDNIFPLSFRGLNTWLPSPMVLGRTPWPKECVVEGLLHRLVDKNLRWDYRKGGWRTWVNIQSHNPGDLLPPARPHLWKFSQPSRTVPSSGDEYSKYEPVGDISC